MVDTTEFALAALTGGQEARALMITRFAAMTRRFEGPVGDACQQIAACWHRWNAASGPDGDGATVDWFGPLDFLHQCVKDPSYQIQVLDLASRFAAGLTATENPVQQ